MAVDLSAPWTVDGIHYSHPPSQPSQPQVKHVIELLKVIFSQDTWVSKIFRKSFCEWNWNYFEHTIKDYLICQIECVSTVLDIISAALIPLSDHECNNWRDENNNWGSIINFVGGVAEIAWTEAGRRVVLGVASLGLTLLFITTSGYLCQERGGDIIWVIKW